MASSITGLREWQQLLEGIAQRQADIRPAEGAFHDAMVEEMERADIPVDTGRLRDSLTNPSSKDHIWKASSDSMELGSKDPASVFNQIGEVDSAAPIEALRGWLYYGET